MKAIVFLSIFSFSAFASDFTKQIWSHNSDHYLFSLHSPSQILVSENCFNDEVTLEQSKCDAIKALNQKHSLTVPASQFSGGKNPGAVACAVGLKMTIRIFTNSKNNENSFCEFNDGSMISAINLQSLLKD
ncbi:hypothetical protein SHI21_15600 [Bacteriovorax sp. PP10]|uniref:Uncharacterized protein n=1 Tax=Bacteriovorax antarcticus TaxID=3088717 RepID=A0ABU5VX65_9BACT|nr:hypothetical protein [Bacteriovorax sp. PP10]MEA9357654.1 hypothetical protein [Bacteriovorax sp. PP10]